jgi:CMP/dCMP kinase
MSGHPRIAITGDIGSGKSAVGKLLRDRLGYAFYSTGELQRRIAAQRGMTTLELNRYADTHPEIDREIDGETVKLDGQPEPFIIDSRIAWHFIPTAFRVYLRVDPGVAVDRIMRAGRATETYATREEGLAHIGSRRRSETARFLETYGIDLRDMRNFDLIVDTSYAPPEAVADVVIQEFEAWRDGKQRYSLYVSPQQADQSEGRAAMLLRDGVPLMGVERPGTPSRREEG